MIYSLILFVVLLGLRTLIVKQSDKFIYDDSRNLVYHISFSMFTLFSISIIFYFYHQDSIDISNINYIVRLLILTSFAVSLIYFVLNIFMFYTKKYPIYIINKVLRRLLKISLYVISVTNACILVNSLIVINSI